MTMPKKREMDFRQAMADNANAASEIPVWT